MGRSRIKLAGQIANDISQAFNIMSIWITNENLPQTTIGKGV
jgi:hypothetical protein